MGCSLDNCGFCPSSKNERALWAQFDALQLGTGWSEEDITKPQILISDVWGDSHPGSAHLLESSTDIKRCLCWWWTSFTFCNHYL